MSELRWELHLLGGFGLCEGGTPVALPPTEERLVALLALGTRPLTREFVASTLWLSDDRHHATASLRTALWRVRKAAPGILNAVTNRLGLCSELVTDVAVARALARQLLSSVGPPPSDRLDLLTHDLLPDWYEDWVVMERERFRQARLHGLETAARMLARQGSYAAAIDAAGLAVKAEPLRESATRVLIEAHLAEGNWVEARRQYEWFEDLLRDELGAAPTGALTSLVSGPPR